MIRSTRTALVGTVAAVSMVVLFGALRSLLDAPAASPNAARSDAPTSASIQRPADDHALPCARLGVYNGWSPDVDHETYKQFGSYPAVAASYYQPYESIRVEQETARIRRGTSPNITITTKGTNRIAALGTGPSHPDHAAARAWLQRHVDALSALAAVDADVPVYATLDHEFRVKARRGEVTGRSADPAQYGQALDLFFRMADKADPRIRTTYWFVGHDRGFEGTVADQFTARPDAVLFDPYARSAGATITSVTAADLSWIRSQDWYDDQEIALGEFGMPVRVGDLELAAFLEDVDDQLAEVGISWAVFFNRERDADMRIVDRTDGRSFPAAVAALRSSISSAARC